jgi:hypothetical protein
VCNILPAVHALTGCDTTSSFFGIGKKTVYKTLIQNRQKFKNLLSLTWRVIWMNVDNMNLKFACTFFSNTQQLRLRPIPKNEDVVSHPVRA